MPIIDIPRPDIDAPLTTPKGFAVTPGADDLDHGSDGPKERPSWSATMNAAFRQDNTVGAYFAAEDRDVPTFKEDGFNSWDDIKGTKYEAYFDSFVNVWNKRHADAVKAKIDREIDDRKTLESAPFYQSLLSSGAASVLDWPTLIPGGAFVRGAKGGFSIARSAATVGAAGGAAAGAQEGALQLLQETRPLSESAVNIGASVFLSGLLGAGGAKLLSNAEWRAAVETLERGVIDVQRGMSSTPPLPGMSAADAALFNSQGTVRLYRGEGGSMMGSVQGGGWFSTDVEKAKLYGDVHFIDVPKDRMVLFATGAGGSDEWVSLDPSTLSEFVRRPLSEAGGGFPTSAGAAAVEPMDIEANAIAGRAAGALAAATKQLNPSLRLLQSPSAASREISTQLFENSLYLKKNFDGVASDAAVETLMKEWNSGLARAVMSSDTAWKEHRKAGGQLSNLQFREAVGKAMRRGDQSDDPHVTKVAQAWRKEVFDPLKEAAIKAGLLPEDVSVETATSYFSRMWNVNKLVAREGEFKGIVQEWVNRMAPKWAEQFDKAAERRLGNLRREIDELEMTKLRRAEELRAREQGGEIEAGEFSEADIRAALRVVQGGAPKPKGVVRLTEWVRQQGGLVDHGGELAHMGINNRTMPGLVRNERRPFGVDDPRRGGLSFEDITHKAWEAGFFDSIERPSYHEFLEALSDDFNKHRAVVRPGDREAFRLQELIDQLEADLNHVGVEVGQKPRFATSEEVKGMVSRVYKAMDAEADQKIARLKEKLAERQNAINVERDASFVGDPRELGREIADEVYNKLVGRTDDGSVRPEFITIKARGPLKERTFNIPDELVEDFLEHDAEHVGRRYVRVMGADVEIANKFGSVDMAEQIAKIRQDYDRLRQGVTSEKELTRLRAAEKADIRDIEALRDILRGTRQEGPLERGYGRIVRAANHVNYLRSMGEVVIASITEAVRPAMVHGLRPFLGNIGQLMTNMQGIKLSVGEAQLAGNVVERVLGHRLATISEIIDPYASRGPVESFLENMTNIASKWNGIRLWTDAMKSIASVMTQNRILNGAANFATIKSKERAYLAMLGIDQSMAERIAKQFAEHGEVIDKVAVANTEQWTDAVAVRRYRAAMNKDVDSIVVQRSVADVPLFAHTPTGKAVLQFKSFALASHQRVLLRGLQEDQARFIGGLVAMTALGMLAAYLKAVSGNRQEKLTDFARNPGWWVGEGLDRSGVLAVPMELANIFEKAAGVNPIKSPFKAWDEGDAISQKIVNRNQIGALLGPSAGLAQDVLTVAGIPQRLARGEEVSQGQKNAGERLLLYNSFLGIRQTLRYLVNTPE